MRLQSENRPGTENTDPRDKRLNNAVDEAFSSAAEPAAHSESAPQQRWLALIFQQLPLLRLAGSLDAEQALAFVHPNSPRQISCANASAAALGIDVGMPVGAAQALAPALRVLEEDLLQQDVLLQRLANRAFQFSSQISRREHGLLIEVGGSERLFGGLETLIDKLKADFPEQSDLAVAPTPQAAWQLAAHRTNARVLSCQALSGALGKLPIQIFQLSRRQQRSLQGMGVERVEQLLRLPRRGLAERFGEALIRQIRQLLGETPDPPPLHQLPASFSANLELALETTQTEPIRQVLLRLIDDLVVHLRLRDAGVRELGLLLSHPQPPHTRIQIGSRNALRDAAQLNSLIEQHLQRLKLDQPVREVGLNAERLFAFRPQVRDLFERHNSGQESIDQLIDRLQARLGHDNVHGLCLVPDHRPEKAWRACRPGEYREVKMQAKRPLWLLETPRLILPGNRPLQGFQLIQGPERLETGWWDDADISRDYWIALQTNRSQPRHCWLYRERRSGDWYLHGLFG